jgi:hypothetical protein
MERLPYIDEHRRSVGATPERTWAALEAVSRRFVRSPAPALFAALWRLEPRSGFAVADEAAPRQLTLRGRHRFSRYELAFVLDPAADGVTLRARTSAVFPGVSGAAYRALVIGSGIHRVVTRRLLREIAVRAERAR